MSALTSSLFFDPTEAGASSNVGAYVRAGSDGDLIASQTIAAEEWLNTAAALFDGSGTAITSTGGALDVNVAAATGLAIYAEDSASADGQDIQGVGAVRQDTLSASLSADGDWGWFKQNSLGELYVKDTDVLAQLVSGVTVSDGGGSITVDAVDLDIRDLAAATDSVAAWVADGSGNAIGSTTGSLNVHVANASDIDIDDDLADTSIVTTATAVSTTAVNVVTSALSGRRHLFLANLGNKPLYFGASGVSVSDGFPLFPREKLAARIGPSIAPQIIGDAGASSEDLRVMELA